MSRLHLKQLSPLDFKNLLHWIQFTVEHPFYRNFLALKAKLGTVGGLLKSSPPRRPTRGATCPRTSGASVGVTEEFPIAVADSGCDNLSQPEGLRWGAPQFPFCPNA